MNAISNRSTKLVTVGPNDKLKMVKEIFDNLKFHHLLVVEEYRVLGVVSNRDLLKAVSLDIARDIYQNITSLNKRVASDHNAAPHLETGNRHGR